jgi:hypothetical protein
VIGLLWSLHGRLESIEGAAIMAAVARAAIGAAAASVVMFAGLQLFEAIAPELLERAVARVVVLGVLVVAGGATYLGVAALIRSPELIQLGGALRRLRGRSAA